MLNDVRALLESHYLTFAAKNARLDATVVKIGDFRSWAEGLLKSIKDFL
jgi:hypothetical protein